ncbi:hypothetical protein J7399_15520 [Shimia sp. R9_1]|uniref:hypothetical protein n=1 Tax=Shimia sp. R9_1 TaxID=2821111 RepID=UPI001ADD299C|nr:hypothetical protein [Shimia sp. R9_1]MBO9408845.1 hypothetical protein [Shimia sp. R9_1]
MKRFLALSLALGFMYLAGCTEQPTSAHDKYFDNKNSRYFYYLQQNMGTAKSAQNYLSGSTIRTFDPYHGTQIEYHAPDGRAYLWYPGNKAAVRSFWETRDNVSEVEICYKYPSKSYNPVTKEHGGAWKCRPMYIFAAQIRERVSGDPFDLARGALPSVTLKKDDRSFAWINTQLRTPIDLTYLDTPWSKAPSQ